MPCVAGEPAAMASVSGSSAVKASSLRLRRILLWNMRWASSARVPRKRKRDGYRLRPFLRKRPVPMVPAGRLRRGLERRRLQRGLHLGRSKLGPAHAPEVLRSGQLDEAGVLGHAIGMVGGADHGSGGDVG